MLNKEIYIAHRRSGNTNQVELGRTTKSRLAEQEVMRFVNGETEEGIDFKNNTALLLGDLIEEFKTEPGSDFIQGKNN